MLLSSTHAEFKWNSNKPSLREKMEREINGSYEDMAFEKAGMLFELWGQVLQTIESKTFQWSLVGAIQDFGSNFLKLREITESVIDSIAKSKKMTAPMVERMAILQSVQKDLDVLYEQYFSIGEANLEIRENDLFDIQKFSTIFTNVIALKRNFDRAQIELDLTDIIDPIVEGLDELLLELKNEINRILRHRSLGENIRKANTYIKLFEMSEEFKIIFCILKSGDIQSYHSEFNYSELDFNLDLATANLVMDDYYENETEEDHYDV